MKSTLFIEYQDEIFVPRPTSVAAGQIRDCWISSCLRKKAKIAAPFYWDWLERRGKLCRLTEIENGFEVKHVSGSLQEP